MKIRKNGKFVITLDAKEIIVLLTHLQDSELPYVIVKNIIDKIENQIEQDNIEAEEKEKEKQQENPSDEDSDDGEELGGNKA